MPARRAIRVDPIHKMPRSEYILGRILEAKGDSAGASEHISTYLELDANAADASAIREHRQNVGKPDATDDELKAAARGAKALENIERS